MADDLDRAVDELVQDYLRGYEPQAPERAKAIHDALWGTQVFSPAEIDVLDSPLVQRLRGIHQTSFAFLTFPTATHSRFEHSLGVAVMATKMADALNRKRPDTVSPVQMQELRISGLLHDCGHGILSHISEEFYGKHPWLRSLKADPFFQAAKPSEILAYKIIVSRPFQEFFEAVRARHRRDAPLQQVDLSRAAKFIIGQAPSRDERYLASLINGPFDADKLDYIARDSYFTGLRLVVDVDRLLYALDVEDIPEAGNEGQTEKGLVIYASGASAFEQILYSKVQLHSLMYKHPKVRAADLMLISFLGYMREQVPAQLLDRFGPHVRLQDPTDYLRYSDYDLLNESLHSDEYLKGIISDLRNRRLMKKALVLSSTTIDGEFDEVTRLLEHPFKDDILIGLRDRIQHELNPSEGIRNYDIEVDLPATTQLNEATLSVVKQPDGEFIPLNQLFPSIDWLDAFVARKWRGHVFCRGNTAAQRAVGLAAKALFQEAPYNLTIRDLALDLALGS